MKIIKTASGNRIKLSKKEWEEMGKKAGWMKVAYEYPSTMHGIISESQSGIGDPTEFEKYFIQYIEENTGSPLSQNVKFMLQKNMNDHLLKIRSFAGDHESIAFGNAERYLASIIQQAQDPRLQ